MTKKSGHSRHLVDIGANQSGHFIVKKVIQFQSFLLGHALDSYQSFTFAVITPEESAGRLEQRTTGTLAHMLAHLST